MGEQKINRVGGQQINPDGEPKSNRIDADDLPVPEREITPDEAKKVKGGAYMSEYDYKMTQTKTKPTSKTGY